MEYHKFIYDEDQIRKFVGLMSPLKDDEVYFVSMSARNKYLTEEERRHYELGRTEMFARELVKPSKRFPGTIADTYIRVLKSMQVSRGGYTSRTGVELPDKCLVVYANINPTSGYLALKAFMEEAFKALFDLRTNPEAPSFFAHLDSKLMKELQKRTGTKTLIDIDFDIPDEGKGILISFIAELTNMHDAAMEKLEEDKRKELKYHIVKTRSGFHFLLDRSSLAYNYTVPVENANKKAIEKFGEDHVEVIVNKDAMIPVPGTIQAGHKVHFITVEELCAL